MGLSLVGHDLLPGSEAVSYSAKHQAKAQRHLQRVLSGVLELLAGAAAGEAVGDLECVTWHLQMACNYLKLAASERSIADADVVDAARDRLTDKLFFLQASLIRYRGAEGRTECLLEGLELMAAVSSLLPADAATKGAGLESDFF